MHRFPIALLLVCCVVAPARSDHYLFVWAGDRELKGNDFLAVVDADPASVSYGRLLTTLVTDQQTVRVHHTEYTTGGLVEIDDRGKAIRSVSSYDPEFSSALLMPYGLVVIPGIDRVVSTNSPMHDDDLFSGVTYQVWRLSDLKLLTTAHFDVGENRYAQVGPQEPRLGPDGTVFVQTLSCGLERISQIETNAPRSELVHTFPGNWCGVPTIVGHYLVQSVPAIHGLIVLDIANVGAPHGAVFSR